MFDKSWDQLTPDEKLEMHTILSDESHSDNESEPTEIIAGDNGDKDEDYDGTAILAGDQVVNIPSAGDIDPAKSLEGVDFSEEAVEYVYPTKATEEFKEDKDPFIDGYAKDDDIETDQEAVEAQVISRKLHGHNDQTIARELVMQYGIPHEQALQKSYSIEVSTNDKVANTFFAKRYHECTEAEKTELAVYGGN